jgi:DNA invertase Pin-like site-specific DNA recombinase
MTLTLAEIARWHARQAKASTDADRDFHAEAAKLLRDLVKRRADHGRNITAALAERKAQGKPLGRPRIDPAVEKAIRASLQAGRKGIHAIAREHGVGSGTVQRIKAEAPEDQQRVKKIRVKRDV